MGNNRIGMDAWITPDGVHRTYLWRSWSVGFPRKHVGDGAESDRAEAVKKMLNGESAVTPIPPLSLGKTRDGHPRHPLYVRGDQPLVPL